MSQTSRMVTVIDGIEVVEVTTHNLDGELVGTHYCVQGEKYANLRDAGNAAKRISEQ